MALSHHIFTALLSLMLVKQYWVGDAEGAGVGGVGLAVGVTVGTGVGSAVGAAVGEFVGAGVKTALSISYSLSNTPAKLRRSASRSLSSLSRLPARTGASITNSSFASSYRRLPLSLPGLLPTANLIAFELPETEPWPPKQSSSQAANCLRSAPSYCPYNI